MPRPTVSIQSCRTPPARYTGATHSPNGAQTDIGLSFDTTNLGCWTEQPTAPAYLDVHACTGADCTVQPFD